MVLESMDFIFVVSFISRCVCTIRVFIGYAPISSGVGMRRRLTCNEVLSS